jgi:hypothetical protein
MEGQPGRRPDGEAAAGKWPALLLFRPSLDEHVFEQGASKGQDIPGNFFDGRIPGCGHCN